ncbi:hypothetical protein [Brevundimonas lenta]|uniref:Spore coat protein U domain-containing protein n=1 Tax=Brevundimonas lenta TaxID=424796 RepID=A0A7W6JC46_9CAUL|nr:hypothetical protein [Brevundimonas lenta]MBB4082327.1 hypothetical protein [Brevundimonas lenta]
MKSTIGLITAIATVAVASSALAQDPQNVTVSGVAEKICTLPASWAFVSGAAGAAGSQFSGNTWTIPETAFADGSSQAVTGSEYAIRIRGTGSCNASHTIRLQSSRGGLRAGDVSAPVPAGFANGRPIRYEAYWSGGVGGGAFGPQTALTASTPGQQSNLTNYVVSGSLAPPGVRTFDLRLGMNRGALAAPLVAGVYSDTVTVTITLAP